MTLRHVSACVVLGVALVCAASAQSPVDAVPSDKQFQAAWQKQMVDGNLKGAIEEYRKISTRPGVDRTLAAQALLRMAECYDKLNDSTSGAVYERLVRDFADTKEAAEARTIVTTLRDKSSGARLIGRASETMGFRPSWDGRLASYTHPETGDLMIRDLRSHTDRRLTNTGGWKREYTDAAALSRDGRQIAWIHYIDRDNAVELRVASLADSGLPTPRVLLRTPQTEGAYALSWSPDARELFAIRQRADKASQIGVFNMESGAYRSVKSIDWRRPSVLSLSPDGRYVAYDVPAGEAGSPRDIFVLAIDGSRETAVARNPANDTAPLWSPDGSRLLFMSDRGGSNTLWSVSVEDGQATAAPSPAQWSLGAIEPRAITADGTLFYLEPSASRATVYRAALAGERVATQPVALSERNIDNNVGTTWSADGRYLAYYSIRRNDGASLAGVLVIRSSDTDDERSIPLPPRLWSRLGSGPRWFPDSRHVLVEIGDAEGSGFGFYRMALDTGNIERLVHIASVANSYDLSRDGRALYFVQGTVDGGQKVVRVDLDNGSETALRQVSFGTEPANRFVISLAVSPDGQQLATMLMGGAVQVGPALGGTAREIFQPAGGPDEGTGAMREALTWSANQQFVIFARGDGTLWVAAADGAVAHALGSGVAGKSPTVHPDGKTLVFSNRPSDAGRLWALEGVAPRSSGVR